MEERKSFIIYNWWIKEFDILSEKEQLQAYKALFNLGFTGEIKEDTPSFLKVTLNIFKPLIEKNYQKHIEIQNNKKDYELEELFKDLD